MDKSHTQKKNHSQRELQKKIGIPPSNLRCTPHPRPPGVRGVMVSNRSVTKGGFVNTRGGQPVGKCLSLAHRFHL